MGVGYSPKIVTDGLVLCLDAANRKSYSGSGNVWRDLSSNGYDFTLVNSPDYSNRVITLDGTNDYAYLPSHNSNLAFSNGSMTLIVWEKIISYGNYGGIISSENSSNSYWSIIRDLSQTNYKFKWGSSALNFPTFIIGKWNMYCAVKDSSTNVYLYFNGFFVSSHTVSQTIPSQNNPITIGSYRYSDAIVGNYLSNQSIGPIQIYNRALTSTEILQNYNATKGRFGL